MSIKSLPEVSIMDVVNSMLELDLELEQIFVPMMWGQPGIGKSDAVKLYCHLLEKKTGKKVVLHDVRLTLYSAVDLKGLPVPNITKTETVWLIPELFKMDESEDVINVLFLDELSSAVPQVLVASYQLMLDRAIGSHKLADNCIIMSAGNRMDDKGVVHKMPSPLANRITHFNMVFDMTTWRKWAFENNVHELVIGFLTARPDNANTFEKFKGTAVAFATPRSWVKTSDIIRKEGYWRLSEVMQNALIQGTVGSVATEFLDYSRMVTIAPTFEQIAKGEWKEFDLNNLDSRDKQDVEYYLYAMLIARLSHAETKQKKAINNVLDFMSEKFSSNEMKTLAYSSVVENAKHLKNVLIHNASFKEWVGTNQDLLKKIKQTA